jgi:hypothetical protein
VPEGAYIVCLLRAMLETVPALFACVCAPDLPQTVPVAAKSLCCICVAMRRRSSVIVLMAALVDCTQTHRPCLRATAAADSARVRRANVLAWRHRAAAKTHGA